MNEEIIKINKLNKSITFINNGIVFSQFGVADEILDLITNLQEKNERLKENAEHNDDVVDQVRWNKMLYKGRIDKVNKYIDDWLFEAAGNGACMDYEDIIEIKHIVNGGDEE